MKTPLMQKVLDEIEKRDLEPRPRMLFVLKNTLWWGSAVGATILGGITIALVIFTYLDHDSFARAQLNETIFEDMLESVPFLWLFSLTLAVVAGKYAIRQTLFGYRYTTAHLVLGMLLGSAILGTLLHVLEAGERIQDFLVERVPYYDELTPGALVTEHGYLEGAVTRFISSDECELVDKNGAVWVVDLGPLGATERSGMQIGGTVLLRGSLEDRSTFRAAQVVNLK